MYLVIGEKPSVSQTLAKKYWEQEKDRMVICQVQTVSLAGVSDIWRNTCPRRYMTAAMRNGSFHSFLFYRNIGSLRWQGIRKKQFEVLKKTAEPSGFRVCGECL